MKKLFVLLSFLMLSFVILVDGNWRAPKESKVNFTIDGMFGKDVNGTISDLSSSILFYPEEVGRSSIKASIKPFTINTKNKKRDKHLRTSDFFDIEKFPEILFASKSFRQLGEYYIVEGDLTLKDVTKPITIPFEFVMQGDSARFKGDFTINRLDYHLGKKSRLMGNEVRIHLDIPVNRIEKK